MTESNVLKWEDIKESADVALLCAPFVYPPMPSIALSIFKNCLAESGISSKVIYPMFPFSHMLGADRAREISSYPYLFEMDEFLFAHLTDVENNYTPDEYLRAMAPYEKEEKTAHIKELIVYGREKAEECVEVTAQKIIKMGAKVLAGSSIFAQQNATLAIFKRVKELDPSVTTMIGGCNVSGEAGACVLRHYKSVDYVFFGEGDEVFADVCMTAMDKKGGEMPYGVVARGEEIKGQIPHRMTKDMNSVPYPDYGDFIEEWQRELSGFYGPSILGPNYDTSQNDGYYLKGERYAIYFEGSRGCWWGQKNKCSFCGLNGARNIYREKSPERLHEEIRELSRRYPGEYLQLTDNVLSMDVVHDLLPKLAADEQSYRLVGEVKTNITEEDISNLVKAGFILVQPGIESVNDHILKLMRKGNTAVNHVAFLKYCRYYGLRCYWNLLYGLPGERKEDYEEMTELIPKIVHLIPPNGSFEILFQNYSRYAEDPEAYGLILKPSPIYKFLFGDNDDRASHMGLYYSVAGGDFLKEKEAHSEVYEELKRAVYEWIVLQKKEGFLGLTMNDMGDGIFVMDTRPCSVAPFAMLDRLESAVYRTAWAPVSPERLREQLLNEGYGTEEINAAADSLINRKLMIFMSGQYLALAIPVKTDRNDD